MPEMRCDTCEHWIFDAVNYYDGLRYGVCTYAFGTSVVLVSQSGVDRVITPDEFFCASHSVAAQDT